MRTTPRLSLALALGISVASVPPARPADPVPPGPAGIEPASTPPALAWPGETIDAWHGFRRHNFTIEGCPAWVVEPSRPSPGNPWSWCLEFPDAFTERCAAPALLAKGFHHAHIAVGNTFGCPAALRRFDEFHASLVARGLAEKPVLIGLSRGGLYAYRWAAENPKKVAVIYGDAPVCDSRSWPGGKGTGKGSPADWKELLRCYGFRDEAEALAWKGNPVDALEPLARAGIPIIHVVGDADEVVPPAENTAVVEARYRALGGEIRVIQKPGVGHHPHGLEDPSPVVDFILERTGQPPPLVLRGGSVFDPIAGTLVADRTVVIEGARIRSVSGPEANVPHGARVVDCRGKFLLPGLIDAHVHLVHLADRSRVVGDEFLPMFLASGVTGVRDAGDEIVAQSVIARAAELRPELCPRVFLTSPLIDADPPLHRDVGYALTDPEKVRSFVDEMALWRVTTLKIYAGTARPVGRAVIDGGHRAGMKVIAHLGSYSAQDAVLDGIDSLEHIWSVFDYIIPPEEAAKPDHRAHLDLGNPLARELVTALARRRVSVDPTLVVFRNMIHLHDLEEVHDHPDVARAPLRMREYWDSYRRDTPLSPETRDARRKEFGKYQELTGLLYRAGVPILAGTDTPEPFVPPGSSLHQELELLVESGLSPAAAIAAATIENARALDRQDRLGSVTPGKLADLVILDADPTTDIRNTRRIHAVVRGGLLCDPATIWRAVPTE